MQVIGTERMLFRPEWKLSRITDFSDQTLDIIRLKLEHHVNHLDDSGITIHT